MNGASADCIVGHLERFAMNIEIMDGPIGVASAVKMCRSIVIKGLEALLLECMVTAAHFLCEDAVLDNLNTSNPEINWREFAEYMIGRILQHGVRRAAEMREVAAMQREAELPATMSTATAEVHDWRTRLPDSSINTTAQLVTALRHVVDRQLSDKKHGFGIDSASS